MKTTIKIINLLGAVLSLLATFGLKQKATSLARILIIALAALAAASSQAAPGGGGGGGAGGTGGGTIYYATGGVMTSMDSDGGNKTQVGRFGTPSTATPSTALHNNHRWFIYTCPISGQYYPNGTPRTEVFALRADYDYVNNSNSNTRVQLTDDITLQPRVLTADWVPSDQFVSFKGRRWSSAEPGATIVEGGIYTAALVFGDDGNIIGLAAQPPTPAIPLPLVESAPGDLWPDVLAYSWSPTADMVAYSNNGDTELWVGDLLGARIRIYNGQAHMPQWSPLGDKIAFTHSGGIWTIKANGTGAKRIIANTSTWSFSHAYWSPTGSHLVFTGQSQVDNNQDYNQDVFRATATGGTLVNLTSTPAPVHEIMWEGVGGWR